MSQPTTSCAWVRGISDTLEAAGLDARALFKEARIHQTAAPNMHARFPTERISQLWELAAIKSGDPAVGLVLPNHPMPNLFDAVGYAMMSSENLFCGIERLIRYLRIVSDAATVRLSASDGACCRIVLELAGGGRPVPRQRFEFDLLALLNFLRWIGGQDLNPQALELAFPRPNNSRPYEMAFQCALRFDAPANSLIFKRADLTVPLRTSTPALSQLHDTFASNLLASLDNVSMAHKVRAVIARLLPDGTPCRPDVAKALGVSERTLQRRLGEESISFHVLLDDSRRELAKDYLGNERLSLSEIAYLLGFADQSNFFRSCKRWFTAPPSELRRRLKHEEAQNAS